MGYSTYSSTTRASSPRAATYQAASRPEEIFKERSMNNAMDPYDMGIRESRDSEEHPNSVAIIIGLDVTGSMGSIPMFLCKTGLPDIMDRIIEAGIPDPQVLFTGVGDHECDRSPLQVGQFESGDELLDKWLTTVYLEGGGGGNDGESYHLAWYMASFYTAIDCLEKRGQKGILITIGDEPVLKTLPKQYVKGIFGAAQASDFDTMALLDKTQKMYNVHHIHLMQGSNGRRQDVMDGWKQLLGPNLKIAKHKEDVADIIAKLVINNSKRTLQNTPVVSANNDTEQEITL